LKQKTAKLIILVSYLLMGVWVVGALTYICDEMFGQHATLAELRAVRAGGEGWEQASDGLVGRGRTGLLFILQEIQQDPGRSRNFRVARALEKAGGRFHPALEKGEKAAVRKLVTTADIRVTDYIDGLKTDLTPIEARFADLAARIFEKCRKESRFQHLDTAKISSVFKKIAAGEEIPEDEATYLRTNFKEAAARIDRCIAGEAFDLYPEERTLLVEVSAYCTSYAIEEGGIADLHAVSHGLRKFVAELTGEMTEDERSALAGLLEDPEYRQAIPADKLAAHLARETVELTEDEKQQLSAASRKLSAQYEATPANCVYELNWLENTTNALAKIGGTFTAELTKSEKSALTAMAGDLQRDEAMPAGQPKPWRFLARRRTFPAEKLQARLEDKRPTFSQDEQKELANALKDLAQQLDEATTVLYSKPEFGYLKDAVAGLDKLSSAVRAAPRQRERSALAEALEGEHEGLPAGKLNAWLAGHEMAFTQDEKSRILEVADEFLAGHENAKVRLGETAVKSIVKMRDDRSRFIRYEVYEDKEKREQGGVLEVIFALWKKIDDKVAMVDMVEISGTENEKLRLAMQDALVAIGQPAVPTLIRGIRREKIDQALAAETKNRTKEERLRELNESNKIVRLSCLQALGRIGGLEAEGALTPFVDDEDADIAAAAAEALRLMH